MAKVLIPILFVVAGCSAAVDRGTDAGASGGSSAVTISSDASAAAHDATTEAEAADAATCFVAKDVYVAPGEDPTVGLTGVLSCSYTDLEAPPILGKPSGLVTYRCILACPESEA
jgi:hypothetical protein